MEFKKPNGYNNRQPGVTVPQRGNATSIKSTRQPLPPVATRPKKFGIHISLGSLPPKKVIVLRTRRFIFSKKGILVVAILVVIIGLLIASSFVRQREVTRTKGGSINPNALIENLEYQTVLPGDKSITQLGGWQRVSPDKNDPVYAYIDKINGVSVSVSQQPLPDSFKNNTSEQVAELAKKFNATTKMAAGETTVYIGTSSKGPQSTIFTKNGLLILIKSQENIDDAAWTKYIESLN